MSMTFYPVATQGIRVFMGVLSGGEPVHEALARLAEAHGIVAGTVELLGGLTEVELTAYDFLRRERLAPLVLQGNLEIVAGHGTISRLDGRPHVHLHLALAWRDDASPHGVALVGGHAARALAFAVEFTLTAYDGAPMARRLDPATGLALWGRTPA